VKYVVWTHISGSNTMSRGYAWRSIIEKLNTIPITYTITGTHCIAINEQDFIIFALMWNHDNLGFLQWQESIQPDERA
jgi:hypothetical protein